MDPPEEQNKESEKETIADREKKLERLKSKVVDQGQDAARVLKMWLTKDNNG